MCTIVLFFPRHPQTELLSYRGNIEEQQQIVESAQAQIEEKERDELELRVELDVVKAEVERLRCSEETLQTRVAGKDKKIAHLEDKVVDLKESRQRRSEIVSTDRTACTCTCSVIG